MSRSGDKPVIPIDETVDVPWGQIRVRCDIAPGSSLAPNLRAVIHARSEHLGPDDRDVLRKILALSFVGINHLNVEFTKRDVLPIQSA